MKKSDLQISLESQIIRECRQKNKEAGMADFFQEACRRLAEHKRLELLENDPPFFAPKTLPEDIKGNGHGSGDNSC